MRNQIEFIQPRTINSRDMDDISSLLHIPLKTNKKNRIKSPEDLFNVLHKDEIIIFAKEKDLIVGCLEASIKRDKYDIPFGSISILQVNNDAKYHNIADDLLQRAISFFNSRGIENMELGKWAHNFLKKIKNSP